MKRLIYIIFLMVLSCNQKDNKNIVSKEITAQMILGNTNYQAICYGGYRTNSREIQPTIAEIKEDLKLLFAIKIKVLRTYNVHYEEVSNLLKAITELKKEDANFEMYVMLGAWIDCKNAWTNLPPIHHEESDRNAIEIAEAVRLTNQYPDIIKIIAVGNEAMVKWATSYYVTPNIILKWVNHLQDLKKQNKLPQSVWITSSDNFASWGGGDAEYHVEELKQLINNIKQFINTENYENLKIEIEKLQLDAPDPVLYLERAVLADGKAVAFSYDTINISSLPEDVVEQTTLGWLGELGFEVKLGEVLSPGGDEQDREGYEEVILKERFIVIFAKC